MKRSRNYETLRCPCCDSPLFLHDLVFLDEGGGITGCCECLPYSRFDETIDQMTIQEYVEQGYVTYIDHKIDRLKEV